MAAPLVLALTFFALTATCISSKAEASSAAAAAQAQTVVTLTFDDGWADQYQGLAMLNAHNMHATYFLNSPRISGDSAYMTWSNVADLAAAGNEIGGHTAYHADLPFIDPTEAQRQICYDRDNLLQRGYNATDFAFPFGDYSPAVKTMVQNCGYNSARTTDVFPQANPSGPIPPPDPYQINVGTDTTTLTSMENAVTAARQNGGGWAPIVFHHICNACNVDYITPSDFNTFLDWLQGQAANNVVVKTMQQVIGGATQPQVPGPGLPPAPNGTNALRNSSLEQDSDRDGIPDCWTNDDFGNNNFTWTRTSDAHSGSFAQKLTVTNYVDGDNKLEVLPDLGYCTPSVNEGHRYRITEWYKSDQPVYFTLFTRDSQWQVRFWDSSPAFPASSTWTQASFVTSVIPAGIHGLVFGLTLGSNGNLTVDDANFDDAAASGGSDTTPPTVSLTAPTANSTVSGFVPISANATDNVAVDHADYLIDGQVAATLTSGPYTYNWNSRSVSNGSHTIAVRAVDLAGNSTLTSAITVFVSNQSNNMLQNPSLEQGTSNPPSCWLLGGYGTNTFTWAWTADAHTGTHSENLNMSSWTNGDRKLLTAFSSACSPAVTPGHTYTISGWYKSSGRGPVFMAFSTTTGGNGAYSFLAQSSVLANAAGWTQASWSTPLIPAGVTNLSVGMGITGGAGSVTMDDFTLSDNAPAPDTTPPTSDLACNGGGEDSNGCAATNGWFNGPVEIDLSATDDPGGSGVARIVYTLDGSTPSATNGGTYMGPFSVGQTTTVKYLAIDKAGNVESPAHSQLVQIDTQPPGATIACNNNPCGSGAFNNAVSVTMNATDTGGSGVDQIIYTLDGTTPSLTNGIPYLGAFSVNTNTTIKFVARDRAGNLSAVNTEVLIVDAVRPVSIISCNNAACAGPYNAAVTVRLSADDGSGSGVAQIRYTTDGSTPTATSGTVYTAPFTLATTTTVKYLAVDNAGNVENPANSKLIQIDTTAPTVSLTAPADGATVTGTIDLTANATDNASVDHVDFLVDGDVVGTDATSPYRFSWNSTTVPDGAHTIAARAVDNAANQTTSTAANVAVSNADTTAPTSTIKCNGVACAGPYSAAVNVTLSATDDPGGSGVAGIYYTTDGTTPTSSTGTLYVSGFPVSATTTVKYRAYDNAGNAETPANSQLITVSTGPTDTTAPTSTIKCNGVACAGPYSAAVNVTLSATDDPGGSGVAGIYYTTDGTTPTSSTGTLYVSGFPVSATTTVKYRAYDNAGNAETPANSQLITVSTGPTDTTAPTSTIKCNGVACAGPYSAAVNVTLSATDDPGGSGVAGIYYTTDGTTPTSSTGTLYVSGFPVSATTTVKYRAYDNAGNAETPANSQLITVSTGPTDTTAPTSTIKCNGVACAGPYSAAVNVTLSATDDPGGSGVAGIYYTTDGTTPTSSTGTLYVSGFPVSATTTVKYRAYDNAGNAETPANSQLITVSTGPTDTTAPTSTIKCNGVACAGPYSAAVNVTLSATDDPGGSGVAGIYYTTDGTTPTSSTGTLYVSGFPVSATTTVKYRAYDNAGNAETPANSQLITVSTGPTDTTAPTSTIKCNGVACAGPYSAAVNVTLSATDDPGGSGVAGIYYTTDGTTPTSSTGTLYVSGFPVSATTTVKYRAYDNAGNAETPANSQLITVSTGPTDTTAPTSTISCNNAACGSGWFNAPISVTLSATDDPGGSGVAGIYYTTDGTTPTSSTGTLYVNGFPVSATTTVKYRAYDNAGNPEATNSKTLQIETTAPTTTIKCNATTCGSSYYTASVSVTLTATDSGGSGVSQIVYTTDGSDPSQSNGTVYSGAFTVSSVATVEYRAFDVAGNAEAVKSQQIQVDSVSPTSTISCNGNPCGSGWFNGSVSVTLAATDTSGGSGVSQIRYTTDGSTPTATIGNLYTGAFTVSTSGTTVKYRAFDVAGNAETTNSQLLQIDTVAPSSSLRCNGSTCVAGFYTVAVSVALTASDVGGSAVNNIVYTTDGSDPTQTNGTVYSGAFTLSATTTVKFRAYDNAGNAEPINSALIQLDMTPPSTTLNCANSPCSGSSWYPSGVSLSLTSTDTDSGVAQIRYTTNGTVPTKTTGSIYTSPFAITATTTINYRAYDNAGNLETNHALTLQVDPTAPTATLTAPNPGAAVSGTVTLSATAADSGGSGLVRVDFLVDGNVVGSASSSPYSYSWNSASVTDANHTIAAQAVDGAGNQGASTAITVTTGNANLLQNPDLESGSGNTPTCWALAGYGTNTFAWTWTTDAHSGSHAEDLNITSYTNGDRKILNAFNSTCSIATVAGRRYTITVWYKSTAKPVIFAFTSTTGPTGAYNYLAQSPQQSPTATWQQATWTTPAMPAGTTNLSIGMGLSGQAGEVWMDDFAAFQTG